MSEKLWYKAARTIVKAGKFPMPVSNTLIELVKTLITEEQARFILNFKKSSLNINQLKQKTDLDDKALSEMLNDLINNAIIMKIPSRSVGVDVYRLMAPFPGIFEFSLMKGKMGEKEKKLAKLFDKIFKEMSVGVQKNYDHMMEQYKRFPPLDRVIPVEEEVEVRQEVVLPSEEFSKIIDNYDTISVSHCYCRHEKDLLNNPCKLDAPREICLLFGTTAQFAIENGFAKQISKEEAKKKLREAEDYGLVHKAFHIHADPKDDVHEICSCCKCCCRIFQLYYQGIMPILSLTSYIAKVIEDECIGCGTCVEKCPIEAIELIDTVAFVNKDKCIGCGICAHHCPEKAIEFKRTGPRKVFILPPKKTPN